MDAKFLKCAVLGYACLACYCLVQIGCQILDDDQSYIRVIEPAIQEVQSNVKGMGLHYLTSNKAELEWWAPNPFSTFGAGLTWLFGLAKVMLVTTAFVYCSFRILRRP